MAEYSTKQRKALIRFLSTHPDELFTVEQIAEGLAEEDEKRTGEGEKAESGEGSAAGISRSSVYRNLPALEAAGLVKRVSIPGRREVFYRFKGSPSCRGCIHLSCRSCGRIFHLGSETSAKLAEYVSENGGFTLDRTDTVISGICAKCKSRNGNLNRQT